MTELMQLFDFILEKGSIKIGEDENEFKAVCLWLGIKVKPIKSYRRNISDLAKKYPDLKYKSRPFKNILKKKGDFLRLADEPPKS